YPNGDTAEALLNSSFDWNGVREPFVVATENDSLNGVAMLMGHLFSTFEFPQTPGLVDAELEWQKNRGQLLVTPRGEVEPMLD
ncbi:hypothetical protein, partial [Klebsiella michiganensis]|uniref:hypothetical protein n=1 Tax=Klebsiella michiganensis TaxID=1134687 RepID=UPI001E378C78